MLLIYDLFVRVVCLAFGVIALKLAWEFGLWRGNGKECIKTNLRRLFAAIAFVGFLTFIGRAVKIVTDHMNIPPEIDDLRVVTTRLIASLPILWAVYKFHKYVVCAQNKAAMKNLDHRSNGSAE